MLRNKSDPALFRLDSPPGTCSEFEKAFRKTAERSLGLINSQSSALIMELSNSRCSTSWNLLSSINLYVGRFVINITFRFSCVIIYVGRSGRSEVSGMDN